MCLVTVDFPGNFEQVVVTPNSFSAGGIDTYTSLGCAAAAEHDAERV